MPELISRSELKNLIDTGDVIVIDTLPAAYYQQMHLPRAINIQVDEFSAKSPVLLPDKTANIVTYCTNSGCTNSQAAAVKLAKLGYTNVRKYKDGIQDWVQAGLPVETG